MTDSPERARAWLKEKNFLFGKVLNTGAYLYLFLVFFFPCLTGAYVHKSFFHWQDACATGSKVAPSAQTAKSLLNKYTGGRVWYADPNTGIQGKIDEASSGDTVLVKKGLYHEKIVMKEGISLIGVSEDIGSVIISGDDPDDAVIWAASCTLIQNLVIRDGEVGICCPEGIYSPSQKRVEPVSDISIDHTLIIKNKIGLFIGADRVTLTNSTISHNKKSGIFILLDPNGPQFHSQGNIIAFNGPDGGIEFNQVETDQVKFTDFLDLSSITFDYTNIYDDLYHYWIDVNSSVKSIPKFIKSMPESSLDPFGVGNLSQDPYFVDPNSDNYHLLSYSACIDQGDPNSDYSGEQEPNGGRVNLGFYANTSQASKSVDFDDDGLFDFQEGVGDLDEDGAPDWKDGDTAVLPLPYGQEKVSLHLFAGGADSEQGAGFHDVRWCNYTDLPVEPPEGFLPFEAIRCKVSHIDQGTEVSMIIFFPKSFDAFLDCRYQALFLDASGSSDTSWQSLPFEVDPNKGAITFTCKDGQVGDKDGESNGVIDHTACLVVPRSCGWRQDKGCFISLMSPYPYTESLFSEIRRMKSTSDEILLEDKDGIPYPGIKIKANPNPGHLNFFRGCP